jgi:signal transduction histidine kinase
MLWAEIFASWLILLLLLFYTYLEVVGAPYLGFNFNGSGLITDVFVNDTTHDLRLNDRLLKVNDLDVTEWLDTLAVPLFSNISPAKPLRLVVQGQEQIRELEWQTPGFNQDEFRNRILNTWILGFFFWVAGLATLLLVRPLDQKRRLFAAFFLLTALWLVVGNTSRWGFAYSRILYRMALWLSVPVMLHLHWLFPRPLGKLPRSVVWTVYAATAVVVVLQWAQMVPAGSGALAYALALLGSFCLLIIHYIRQPEARAHVRLLLFALIFAIIPMVGLTVTIALWPAPRLVSFALASLPIIPGAYFYSIYRFQLGGSEFRANRLIAVYLFLILLSTVLLTTSAFLSLQVELVGETLLLSSALGLAAALVTLYGFPPFQRLVERHLLAMPLPSVHLIDTYLARITTTLNIPSLIHLLKDEVLPSLLIRHSALFHIHNNQPTPIYTADTEGAVLPPSVLADLVAHLKQNAVYRAPTRQADSGSAIGEGTPAPTWVRLGLALRVEGRLIGLWLLGRHDPDDIYSPVEIVTLQTLARQTALALANMEQSTQLQALYQANVERQEAERKKLAHLLHDAILNQAAVLYMSLDASALSPRVQNAYDTLKLQVHQMISDLRPPSLDLGLHAALEELAEELEQRDQAAFSLQLTMPTSAVHYPPQIENHIFRIVQQACENALRHAHAQLIQISGTLAPDHVEIVVEDDGVGFALGKPLDLAYLLAHKHFGLVHMMERAEHISAEFALDSAPGQGTRVRLTWWDNNRMGD